MLKLDFASALQDKRLTPLIQLISIITLDEEILPININSLNISRVYHAAVAPPSYYSDNEEKEIKKTIKEIEEKKFSSNLPSSSSLVNITCDAALYGLCAMKIPSITLREKMLTPTFISQSVESSSFISEYRLAAQLQHQELLEHLIFADSQ